MRLLGDKAKVKINKPKDNNQKTPTENIRKKIQWGQFVEERRVF